MPRKRRSRRVWAAILWLALGTAASAFGDAAAALPERYRKWLAEVAVIITKEERRAFLGLDKDYQRDGFIARFWEARDPYPDTIRNEFKILYEARLDRARELYGNLTEDRARMLLLHGEPQDLRTTQCQLMLWPLEIWRYVGAEGLTRGFTLIFYQTAGGGTFKLWRRADGFHVLMALFQSTADRLADDELTFYRTIHQYCLGDGDLVIAAVRSVIVEDQFHLLDTAERSPFRRDPEWLTTFRNAATDVPSGAPPLAASLAVDVAPGEGPRDVVRGTLRVPTAALSAQVLGERRAYELELHGEVLRGAELFETFRYRFDLPVGDPPPPELALVFERHLRPGEYRLVLRLEEPQSHRNWREERPLVVPEHRGAETAVVPTVAGPPAAVPPPAARAIVKLAPPKEERVTGPQRFDALVDGEGVARVVFELDDKVMLERAKPPWTVELNLGAAPAAREVRAIAYDAAGRELGSDVLLLNAARQAFRVRLLEPRPGASAAGLLRVRVELQAPEDATVDRLELFVGDQRVATLYQAPWAATVQAPAGGPTIVRAVGYLAGDPSAESAEDTVLLGVAGAQERLDVRLVELYAAVEDSGGHPVGGLTGADFQVLEQGRRQDLLRCEPVENRPLRLVLAIDTSASMAESLPFARQAALRFLDRVLRKEDRAALVSFSDQPRLEQPLTAETPVLASALARLQADRGTALYDAAIFALDLVRGAREQAAVLLLTDGGDRMSRVRFEDAVDFARRSGVALYALGLGISRLDLGDRNRLCKLAEQTGGRCFFPANAGDLDSAYAAIEQELRTRYLLVYQPATAPRPGEFRPIEVKVKGEGRRVRVASGYAP